MVEALVILLIGLGIGAIIGFFTATFIVDESQDIDEDDLFKG